MSEASYSLPPASEREAGAEKSEVSPGAAAGAGSLARLAQVSCRRLLRLAGQPLPDPGLLAGASETAAPTSSLRKLATLQTEQRLREAINALQRGLSTPPPPPVPGEPERDLKAPPPLNLLPIMKSLGKGLEELHRLRSETETLAAELRAASAERDEFLAEAQRVARQYQQAQAERETGRRLAGTVAALERETAQARQQAREAQEAWAAEEADRKKLDASLEEARRRLVQLQETLERQRQEFAQQLGEAAAAAEGARSEQVALRQENQRAREALRDLELRLSAKEAQTRELGLEAERRQKETQSLQARLDLLEGELTVARQQAEKFQQEGDDAREQLAAAAREAAQIKAEWGQLAEKARLGKSELDRVRQRLQAAETARDTLAGRLRETEAQLEPLRREKESSVAAKEELQNELLRANELLARLAEELRQLSAQETATAIRLPEEKPPGLPAELPWPPGDQQKVAALLAYLALQSRETGEDESG